MAANEIFSVVALPHSHAKDAPFHVSLFVAPRLSPDGVLKEFDHFVDWAGAVVSSETAIELRDDHGPIGVSPILDIVDPGLWRAVFPLDTPVRTGAVPEWDDRHWRTFSAARVHDAAKWFQMGAVGLDQTELPSPSSSFHARMMRGHLQPGEGGYDETEFTKDLDELLGEDRITDPMSLAEISKNAGRPLVEGLLAELHRVRRFYERPEAAQAYRERPKDGASLRQLERPAPDFHERCTIVGDHGALLRRLGLVIDLRVDEPARLRSSAWLSGTIHPLGDAAPARPTRTRCTTWGQHLVVTALSGSEWSNGRLRLGDKSLFSLLDVDVDSSALKLERFLYTLPRLQAAQQNGDPVHAAPPALRSTGYVVARNGRALRTQERLSKQLKLQDDIAAEKQSVLTADDVTRGMRVEVWDATVARWQSLHARRLDVEVLDHGPVLSDVPDVGYIQGTAASETGGVKKSPIHVHEAVFGWEGWSLSAPKPGMRVRHRRPEDPAQPVEIIEAPDTDPDHVTPLVITTRVEPGSLPRLRYGRSYAFRAWAVDLAGNSRPHDVGTTGGAASPAVVAAVTKHAVPLGAVPAAADLMKVGTRLAAEQLATRAAPAGRAAVDVVKVLERVADSVVQGAVLSRMAERAGPAVGGRTAPRGIGRAEMVSEAFRRFVGPKGKPWIVSTAEADAAATAAAINEQVALAEPKLTKVQMVIEELQSITPILPFLRWDPVLPPALVSRRPYTSAESLRQVVVRSGVQQDLDTLEITVTTPAAFAAAAKPAWGYQATSERHVAPPKTSQSQAELHGCFDSGIGSTSPSKHDAALAAAVRESGTFFDETVPRLDDITVEDDQVGIDMAYEPTVPAKDRIQLPIPLGEPVPPGVYVIHDTDQLQLPYLPDPLAQGISLVFPDAGTKTLEPRLRTQGFTAAYKGSWPAPKPFRLVLAGGTELRSRLTGTALRFELPPGDVQRFRLSSSIGRDDLDLFGIWRGLDPELRDDPVVLEAAADGWMWALTPHEMVTLVHAVPRPIEVPRPTVLVSRRHAGETTSTLYGGVDVHGPSTDSLTAEASWTEVLDDPTAPGPAVQPTRSVAFTVSIDPDEDLAVLWDEDSVVVDERGGPSVWTHANVHQFTDTKHRRVAYRFRATTRFREYFDPSEITVPLDDTAPVDAPRDDGRSVVGPLEVVSVQSTARPAPPIVHSVIPLFRWDEGTEPEQPVGYRRRRRTGVRIYLERPWYSSGEGELLAVLLAPTLAADKKLDIVKDKKQPQAWWSQWGADPLWDTTPIEHRAIQHEQLDDVLHRERVADVPSDAGPVAPEVVLPLMSLPSQPDVSVLGYRPQYNEERRLWYVDVGFDPDAQFWPFVRLVVARYQPESIGGCHLSAPVRCDYVQLTPERTASVSRTDERHVRVVLSGPVGSRALGGESDERREHLIPLNRSVIARLQRRDPDIDSDLGWTTVDTQELAIKGHGPADWDVTWLGSLAAPTDIPLARPGSSTTWRVTIEEWEKLAGDPGSMAPKATRDQRKPVWERRLVYADELAL
jgi:hypothetical protein